MRCAGDWLALFVALNNQLVTTMIRDVTACQACENRPTFAFMCVHLDGNGGRAVAKNRAARPSAAGAEVVDDHLHGLGLAILDQGELAEILAENH